MHAFRASKRAGGLSRRSVRRPKIAREPVTTEIYVYLNTPNKSILKTHSVCTEGCLSHFKTSAVNHPARSYKNTADESLAGFHIYVDIYRSVLETSVMMPVNNVDSTLRQQQAFTDRMGRRIFLANISLFSPRDCLLRLPDDPPCLSSRYFREWWPVPGAV